MSRQSNRIVTAVLAVAAALAVGAAGYRRWVSFESPAPGGARRPAPIDSLAYSQQEPARLVTSPASQPESGEGLSGLLGDLTDPTGSKTLSSLVGMQVVDGDPAGLAPPPGAQRITSLRTDSEAGRQELGRYLVKSSPGVLESFYAQSLPAAGWQKLARKADGGLVFRRQQQSCLIRLLPRGQETEVSVVVSTLPK